MRWTGADEYHLFGKFADDELVGVAGVLVREFLHHTKHAWLYDLVVDEPVRGRGYGAELVNHVEEWASERNCEYLALATPLEKENVHDFYGSLDFEKWGYVIEKKL